MPLSFESNGLPSWLFNWRNRMRFSLGSSENDSIDVKPNRRRSCQGGREDTLLARKMCRSRSSKGVEVEVVRA